MKRILVSCFVLVLLLSGCHAPKPRILARDIVYGVTDNNILCIPEREQSVPYYCFDSDYGVLCVRKEYVRTNVMFNDISFGGSYYSNSNLDLWLDKAVFDSFDSSVENYVETVEIKIRSKDLTDIETIERQVFVLSLSELGIEDNRTVNLGHKIEGVRDFDLAGEQWLRDAFDSDIDRAWCYSESGYGPEYTYEGLCVRPCFVINKETEVEWDSSISGYVIKQQPDKTAAVYF